MCGGGDILREIFDNDKKRRRRRVSRCVFCVCACMFDDRESESDWFSFSRNTQQWRGSIFSVAGTRKFHFTVDEGNGVPLGSPHEQVPCRVAGATLNVHSAVASHELLFLTEEVSCCVLCMFACMYDDRESECASFLSNKPINFARTLSQ